MTADDWIGLASIGIFFGGLLIIVGRAWRSSRLDETRWKLFAVRDDLCFLIATGVVREDNLAYQLTVKQLNTVIVNAEHFNFRSFSRAVVDADRHALDGRKRQMEYWAAVEKAPMELQEAVHSFYVTTMDLLLANSLLLHAVVWSRQNLEVAWKAVEPVRVVVRKFVPDPGWEAYRQADERLAKVDGLTRRSTHELLPA